MAEEASWDQQIEDYLTSEGACYAAGLAQATDGAFYAAAPQAGEEGWGHIFKDAHDEKVLQDDGVTEKTMSINEASGIKSFMETGKKPEGGLWIGGTKYNITQFEKEFESGDHTLSVGFVQAPKKGAVFISTGGQICAGFYNEEKGQTAPNCRKAVLAFGEYLKGIGY